jgi:protein-S-isoprenylcysteine O-methyltransferase Ste14
MAPQHITVIVLAVVVYGAFAWGFVAHFRRPQGIPWLLHLTGVAATALTVAQIAQLWRADPGWWAAPAIIGYAGAAALYGWTVATTRHRRPSLAFSSDAPTLLLADGPYRYVRHPFYAAYLLYWLAGAAALRELWLVPAVAAVAALYVLAALMEERKFERSAMVQAYGAYRRSTGMFLPRLKALR